MFLTSPNIIDINTVIICCLTVLWALSLALIKYVVGQKDKQTDLIGQDIKEMKEILTFMQANNATLRTELDNLGKNINNLTGKTDDITKTVYEIKLDQVQLKEWRISADRKFDDLYKSIDKIKEKLNI
jgi:septal ring factor EnvC (AmiA/AmiB activator)